MQGVCRHNSFTVNKNNRSILRKRMLIFNLCSFREKFYERKIPLTNMLIFMHKTGFQQCVSFTHLHSGWRPKAYSQIPIHWPKKKGEGSVPSHFKTMRVVLRKRNNFNCQCGTLTFSWLIILWFVSSPHADNNKIR